MPETIIVDKDIYHVSSLVIREILSHFPNATYSLIDGNIVVTDLCANKDA